MKRFRVPRLHQIFAPIVLPAALGCAARQVEVPAAGPREVDSAPRITFEPESAKRFGKRVDILEGDVEVEEFLQFLADYTGRPVLVDGEGATVRSIPIKLTSSIRDADDELVKRLLETNKWLVHEEKLHNGKTVLLARCLAPPMEVSETPEGPCRALDGHVPDDVVDPQTDHPEPNAPEISEMSTILDRDLDKEPHRENTAP
jgi:hypothetical protein